MSDHRRAPVEAFASMTGNHDVMVAVMDQMLREYLVALP